MSSAVNRHSLPEVSDTPRELVLHTQALDLGSTTYKSLSSKKEKKEYWRRRQAAVWLWGGAG